MGIGASIFLLALGAILAFAVEADISGLDINVIGWILMIAGLAGLVITLWFWNSRRRTVVTRSTLPQFTIAGSILRRQDESQKPFLGGTFRTREERRPPGL